MLEVSGRVGARGYQYCKDVKTARGGGGRGVCNKAGLTHLVVS